MDFRTVYNIRLSETEREILSYNAALNGRTANAELRSFIHSMALPPSYAENPPVFQTKRHRRTNAEIARDKYDKEIAKLERETLPIEAFSVQLD